MPTDIQPDSGFSSLILDKVFLTLYNAIFESELSKETALEVSREIWGVVSVIGIILIVLLIGVITYTVMRIVQVRKEENIRFAESTHKDAATEPTDERWERIVELSSSTNPSDWRLSVIEADILLDELLTDRGYSGEGLGEKLKDARSRGGLKEIDRAWEAHLVRNQIAHTGSDFILTQREARRTIDLYRQVFGGSFLV